MSNNSNNSGVYIFWIVVAFIVFSIIGAMNSNDWKEAEDAHQRLESYGYTDKQIYEMGKD